MEQIIKGKEDELGRQLQLMKEEYEKEILMMMTLIASIKDMMDNKSPPEPSSTSEI